MPLQLPREPRPGEKIDAVWAAQVVRYLRAITPHSSGLVRVNSLMSGTTLAFSARRGTGTPPIMHPFQISNASSGGVAKVAVRFGQVNSVTPTIDTDPLDDDPPPVLSAVITGVVYLQVNLDEDGLVETAEIGNAAELPDSTETEGYVTLATITVASNDVTEINQSVTHSLGHQKCGEDVHNFWGL